MVVSWAQISWNVQESDKSDRPLDCNTGMKLGDELHLWRQVAPNSVRLLLKTLQEKLGKMIEVASEQCSAQPCGHQSDLLMKENLR